MNNNNNNNNNNNTSCENIQSRYRNGIWQKNAHARNKKQQTTRDGKSQTTQSSLNQKAGRKGNQQILMEIGSWNHEISRNEWKKIKKEYLRRIRKLLETKLYSRNLVKRISTWAVLLVRYSRPFLKWTREELKQMDQRARKQMTMQKASRPRYDVDRLYVKKRGRKRTCQHWRQHWCIDTMTQRIHRNARRKTDYSHRKQYWWHEDQQKDNSQKTKEGRKTTLWTF